MLVTFRLPGWSSIRLPQLIPTGAFVQDIFFSYYSLQEDFDLPQLFFNDISKLKIRSVKFIILTKFPKIKLIFRTASRARSSSKLCGLSGSSLSHGAPTTSHLRLILQISLTACVAIN